MVNSESYPVEKLTLDARRRSIGLAYFNGGLWGIGNGLAGTTLLFYLAASYGVRGLTLSWLLAAPSLVGVLRLFTPLWLDRVGNRRRFCTRMFFISALVLLGLPLMSAPGVLPQATQSIVALTTCWAGYHLFEHFAVVALWSWFADLVPQPIRGRFVGRRQGWMNGGKVLGIVISAVATVSWQTRCEVTGHLERLWIGFAALTCVGAIVMLFAIWPLHAMTDPASPSRIGAGSPRQRLGELLTPFSDGDFRRLLYYGLWFSFANGIADTAVRVYQISILQLTYAEKRILDATSRGIQSLVMPWAGAQADRHGNVPVLVVSQGLVAAALLFFLIAAPDAKWWVVGAYVCWIAYAGTNVAMPNLMLRLSAPECSAAYSAAWFASTQLAYALSALAGGLLFDILSDCWQPTMLGNWEIDHFALLLIGGCVLRMLGILWARRIPEPSSTSRSLASEP
ncbi:MAG: MFS transporter [Planctomycetales bacterium]|nr:MFS transporter [Planctomycetales bacterium]